MCSSDLWVGCGEQAQCMPMWLFSIPSDVYDPFLAEKWHEVSEKLPDDYFIETINGAIMAVYDI